MSSAGQQPPDAATPSVANAGVVRPPVVVLASLLLGAALTVVWPFPFVPPGLHLIGAVPIAMAAALFAYAISQFRTAGTPVPGHQPTAAIVRTGPYRFSRNPIYVAFFTFQLGTAIVVNSVWLVATLIATVATIAAVVVTREERYLTERFGAEYLEYKTSVRRWL